MKGTLLFDMDGVLINTHNLHRETLQEAALMYGILVHEAAHDTRTSRVKLAEAGCTPAQIEDIYMHKKALYIARLPHYVEYNFRLRRALTNLETHYLMGIVSNSNLGAVALALALLGVSDMFHPGNIVTADRHPLLAGKPAPDLYKYAMDITGSPVHRTTAFEDSEHGITSAMQAGCQVVHTNHKHLLDELCRF